MKETHELHLPSVETLAPLFSLPATDDRLVKLADYPKPLALIFMRHLA